MKKTDKPIYYTAMTILVEAEVRADSQEQATAMLRHKIQTLAVANSDLALHEMVSKSPNERDANIRGFNLTPLP